MKDIQLGVILLLLVTYGSTQTAPAAGISCPNNNPFINSFASYMPLYNTPLIRSDIPTCEFEFNTYGTCCDPWQLKSYAENQINHLKQELPRVNAEYIRFQGLIPQLYQTFRRIVFAPKHPWRNDWNSRIDQARALFNDPTVYNYFKEFMGSQHQTLQDFENLSNACWEMQWKVRSLTLCYTCSGRSNHFFRDGKALINQNTCNAFVDKCSASLSALVKFVRSLKILPWLAEEMKKFDLYLNADSKLVRHETERYVNAFEAEQVPLLIENAKTQGTSESKANLCSKFFKVKETPIVIQMRSIFSSESAWSIQLWDIKNHLDQSAAQIDANIRAYDSQFSNGAQPTNWQFNRRRLQRVLQFGNNFLYSDASIISPSDPSYSSVGVSGYSPMEFGNLYP